MITINRNNPTPGEITSSLTNSTDAAGLHFDGAAGNIDIATPPDLGTAFSFEFIVQADSATNQGYLLDFYGSSPAARFGIFYDGSGSDLYIYDTNNRSFGAGSVLGDTKVHHLVITVDDTAAILYDNGNQIGTATLGASPTIDTADTAKIGSRHNGTGYFLNGTLYRTRLWNKTLTAAEVTATYENATVPFADQYGSQTEKVVNGAFAADSDWTKGTGWTIAGGAAVATSAGSGVQIYQTVSGLTVGKPYRLSFEVSAFTSGSVKAYAISTANSTSTVSATGSASVEFTATGTAHLVSVMTQSASTSLSVDNVSVVAIGCVADYDLAFANPTQSTMVQDRAGAADGTSSATGVTQVTKIVQVNATAARIGTSAATPADGEVVAEKITAAQSGTDVVALSLANTNTDTSTQTSVGLEFKHNNSTGICRIRSQEVDVSDNFANLIFDVAGGSAGAPITALTIDSTGNVAINNDTASAKLDIRTDGSGTALRLENSSGGYFTVADGGATTVGGLATFSAGIAFESSTSGTGSSASSYTLDHYEEGTWTPTLNAPSTGSITYTSAGQYTRIGDLVHITAMIDITAVSGLTTDNFRINNVPFNAQLVSSGKYNLNNLQLSWVGGVKAASRTDDMSIGAYSDADDNYIYRNLTGTSLKLSDLQVGYIQYAGTFKTKDS